MCGSCVNALDMIVSNSDSHERLELQVVDGAHGVKNSAVKNHKHEHGSYDKSGDYQGAPNYEGMNPEYSLKGPFMNSRYFGAANNGDYSRMENYLREENSGYAKVA